MGDESIDNLRRFVRSAGFVSLLIVNDLGCVTVRVWAESWLLEAAQLWIMLGRQSVTIRASSDEGDAWEWELTQDRTSKSIQDKGGIHG